MTGKFPKRGEVYRVNLDPTIGSETKKARPGLIISNDIGNELSGVVIVAPITSKVRKIYPFEVEIKLNGKEGKIMLHQCRAIDKSRLGEKMGEIGQETMSIVEKALKIVFSLN